MSATRERLPHRRAAETFDIEVGGQRFHATVGRFEDGRPAEIFLNSAKPGSTIDTAAVDSAILASLGLQHGIPLNVIKHALQRDARGAPIGPLGVVLDLLAEEVGGAP
jgi:hypothetical protein